MSMRWVCLLIVGLVVSCASPPPLDIRPTHIRDTKLLLQDTPYFRAEQRYRFHGAIGRDERRQRLGHYYTVDWHDEEHGGSVVVKFEYRQGSTASKVHTQEQQFEADQTDGTAEFEVIGDDYLKGGRVLAWRCSLWRGGQEIAQRNSYLWE